MVLACSVAPSVPFVACICAYPQFRYKYCVRRPCEQGCPYSNTRCLAPANEREIMLQLHVNFILQLKSVHAANNVGIRYTMTYIPKILRSCLRLCHKYVKQFIKASSPKKKTVSRRKTFPEK